MMKGFKTYYAKIEEPNLVIWKKDKEDKNRPL